MYNFLEKLKQLNADPNFTREEKTQIINEAFSNYRKQVDRDYQNYLTKQYAGEALQLASALPQGRATKLGMQYFGIPAAKHLGRNIAQQTGAGMFSGAAGGGLFGLGHGLSTDQNPLKTSAIGAGAGALFGAGAGIALGKGNEIYQAGKLKSFGDIDTLSDTMRKQYRQASKNYYQDFIQGRVINKDGDINFTNRGQSENSRWNPKQGKNYPELVRDIKNAEGPFYSENINPSKLNTDHFDVYKGKNGNHYIEVRKTGERRYYTTRDDSEHPIKSRTVKDSLRTTSTGVPDGSNNIINHPAQDFNPEADNITLSGYISKDVQRPQNAVKRWFNNFKGETTGHAAPAASQQNPYAGFRNPLTGNNKIYTRQELGAMSDNDFEQNEKEIMSQVKTRIGIPHEDELKPFAQDQNSGVVYIRPYTRSDGVQVKGHYRAL